MGCIMAKKENKLDKILKDMFGIEIECGYCKEKEFLLKIQKRLQKSADNFWDKSVIGPNNFRESFDWILK